MDEFENEGREMRFGLELELVSVMMTTSVHKPFLRYTYTTSVKLKKGIVFYFMAASSQHELPLE